MNEECPRSPLEGLVGRLREYEGSDALGNGDFSLLREAADEIERLQADAARYRWLRDDAIHHGREDGKPTPWVVIGTCGGDALPHWHEDLDKLIDEQMTPNA